MDSVEGECQTASSADIRCPDCLLTAGAPCLGFRTCPGKGFAQAEMFLVIAMVLHVFDISPPLDEDENPIVIEPKVKRDSTFLL